MKFEVTWLSGAQADMIEAYARLGDAFYQRVDKAIGLLVLFPEMARLYTGRFRRLILTGTPFGLFYGTLVRRKGRRLFNVGRQHCQLVTNTRSSAVRITDLSGSTPSQLDIFFAP